MKHGTKSAVEAGCRCDGCRLVVGLRKRKPYTESKPDLEDVERLDLQTHLIERYGFSTDGTLEELKEKLEWIRKFSNVKSQG